MYLVETRNPLVPVQGLQRRPGRFRVGGLQQPFAVQNELAGLDIGKFFSRVFHWKGIKRKLPMIGAGAAAGFIGGGVTGLTVGAITPAILRKRASSDVWRDIYQGALYGGAAGTVAGGAMQHLTGGQTGFLLTGVGGKLYNVSADSVKRMFSPSATPQQVQTAIRSPNVTTGEVLQTTGSDVTQIPEQQWKVATEPREAGWGATAVSQPEEFSLINPTTWDWGGISKAVVEPLLKVGVSALAADAALRQQEAVMAQQQREAEMAAQQAGGGYVEAAPLVDQYYMPTAMGPGGPVYGGGELTSVPMDMGLMMGPGGGGGPLMPGFGDMPTLLPGGAAPGGIGAMLPKILPVVAIGLGGYLIFRWVRGR